MENHSSVSPLPPRQSNIWLNLPEDCMSKPKVLIVDDVPVNIRILASILNTYEILEATNGSEALDMALAESPDLILLDIMLRTSMAMKYADSLRQIAVPAKFQ